jgi:hypothetical protein
MIKVETIGMLDVAKINPVLTSDKDVTNNDFITDNGILYLIDNTIVGDDAYKDGAVIPAGEYLNGYQVKAWEGQKLVVDGKHVTDGISALKKGDVLVAGDDGKLEKGDATGVHFVVSDTGVVLTEAAIKVVVTVA